MRSTNRLLALLVAMTAALPANAQFAKPEEAVKYRQGAWSVLNHHFIRIGTMVRGRMPYEPRIAAHDAEMVALLARLPGTAFGPGTDTAADHARAEIWTEQPRFREMNDRLLAETARLAAAAKTQNLDQLKAAYGAAANTCKECHDAYRSH